MSPSGKQHSRIASIEILRIVAALLIIYWHTAFPALGAWVTWSLIYFVLVSVSFTKQFENEGTVQAIARLSKRYMTPWLSWSIIFYALKLIDNGWQLEFPYGYSQLLIGGSLHLWYLPFALFASACALAINGRLFSQTHTSTTLACLFFFALIYLCKKASDWHTQPPLSQYLTVIPSVVLGFWFANREAGKLLPLSHLAVIVAVCSICVFTLRLPLNGLDIQNILAFSLLLIAYQIPTSCPQPVAYLASLTFGMYLTHPLFIAIESRMPTHDLPIVARYALIVVASAFLAGFIQRTQILRKFLS